jgi:hypothetical protein
MLSRPCLGPPDPGGSPWSQNIAYDVALVKLGPHTKFGEDWSNGVFLYRTDTQIHLYIYMTSWGTRHCPGHYFKAIKHE